MCRVPTPIAAPGIPALLLVGLLVLPAGRRFLRAVLRQITADSAAPPRARRAPCMARIALGAVAAAPIGLILVDMTSLAWDVEVGTLLLMQVFVLTIALIEELRRPSTIVWRPMSAVLASSSAVYVGIAMDGVAHGLVAGGLCFGALHATYFGDSPSASTRQRAIIRRVCQSLTGAVASLISTLGLTALLVIAAPLPPGAIGFALGAATILGLEIGTGTANRVWAPSRGAAGDS